MSKAKKNKKSAEPTERKPDPLEYVTCPECGEDQGDGIMEEHYPLQTDFHSKLAALELLKP